MSDFTPIRKPKSHLADADQVRLIKSSEQTMKAQKFGTDGVEVTDKNFPHLVGRGRTLGDAIRDLQNQINQLSETIEKVFGRS